MSHNHLDATPIMAAAHPNPPVFSQDFINLASPTLGSQIVNCSDDFFAPAERMLTDGPAIFIPGKYDEHGKWMDGWESRRRRGTGYDWCVVKLGQAGSLVGVDIDTSHFTGNYPPSASLEACLSDKAPDEKTQWVTLIPSLTLGPSAHHYQAIEAGFHNQSWNYVRLNIYPDGGVARLRLYGKPHADWQQPDLKDGSFELSALHRGGQVLAWNDAHFGHPWRLLAKGRGVNMGDGWETRRRREPGNDWLILSLGKAGQISSLDIDTAHFKGNFPAGFSLQAANITTPLDRRSLITAAMFWKELVAYQSLQADHLHHFGASSIEDSGPITHVRLNIYPDGGVSRLRLFGKPV